MRNIELIVRRSCSFRPKSPYRCLIDLKLVYSYVIEVADSESDFGLHNKTLVSEILLFIRIRVTHFAIYSNKINIYLQLKDFFALLFEEIAKCLSLLFK